MTELASQVKRGVRDLTRRSGESPPDVAGIAIEALRNPRRALRSDLTRFKARAELGEGA